MESLTKLSVAQVRNKASFYVTVTYRHMLLLMMIKEDNLGDKDKLYLTLHKVDSLHSENCKMGQKAGSFYKTENKKEGRERKYLIDCGHIVNLDWGEKGQGSNYSTYSWCVDWSSKAFTRIQKL